MQIRIRRKAPLILLIVLSSLFVLAFAAPASASPAEQIGTGTIGNASYVNMRTGPGVGYPVVARLGRGAFVTLFSRNSDGTWVEVSIAGGTRGWVNARYVVTVTPIGNIPPSNPLPVNNAVVRGAYFLNVRSGPSAGFGVVGRLSLGEAVTLVGRVLNNTWLEVITQTGVRGWVNASYVTANVPLGSLPITGEASGVPTQPPPPNASPTGVATANLNVRALPGLYGAVIGWVGQGQSVSMLGRDLYGAWILVQVPSGITGWVSATYIMPYSPIANLPIAV